MIRVYLLVLSLLVLISCNDSKTQQQAQLKDITPKKDYAMLIVESESCIYCKQLDKDLKGNPHLREKTTQLDVFKIDVDGNGKVRYNLLGESGITTESSLARTLKVSSFPYILFYDTNGNVILSLPGYVPPRTLACIIDYVKNGEYQKGNLTEYLKGREC